MARWRPQASQASEGELEKSFGVSRVTVRQALAELHAAGLIEKVNGKGSFVTRPAPARDLGPLNGFYETMRRRGHLAFGKVSRVRTVRAAKATAVALGVAIGTPLSALTITRYVDGAPVARGNSYSLPGLIARLAAEDLETNDVIGVLQDRLGYRLEQSQLEFSAEVADARGAAALGIAPGAPLLRLRIVSVDMQGKALLYSDFMARGDRFTYRVNVKR